jgi:transposase
MSRSTLLPGTDELSLDCIKAHRNAITVVVHAARPAARCPRCDSSSRRIHSHYARKLADLPWNGIAVHLQLRTRRFFCAAEGCGQRIFTERLPDTVVPHGRRTRRLKQVLDWFSLALGGAAGSRLARKIGIIASGDTLLRQLRRMHITAHPVPRVLGIDDWAWCKGRRYGSILCDLERGRVVDLLPDRDVETVTQWLRLHPGIEVISRDRASAFAEAARRAVPQAIQVADRWHLLHNLTEAFQKVLETKHGELRKAAQRVMEERLVTESICVVTPHPQSSSTRYQSQVQRNRCRRRERYESVMALIREGISRREAARQMGMNRHTVGRWVDAGSFPERQPRPRKSTGNGHANYLQRRFREGCHNATQLWRELRELGCKRGKTTVRTWVRDLCGPGRERKIKVREAPFTGSARQTVWLILKEPPEAQAYLQEVYRRCPDLAQTGMVVREFFRMARERDWRAWPAWQQAARTTPLARFAAYLGRDMDAVLAGLRVPWSNGPVEGQVHRLKLIKRQMYGRAKFDLLRLRVLHAP